VQRTLLSPRPDAPLRVYAIWFNMYPGDARDRWREELLPDARVRHYWDEQRAIGRLYLQMLPRMWPMRATNTVVPQSDALWDAYLLYGSDVEWDDQPPDVVIWGSTILRTHDSLERDLQITLTPPVQ